MVQKDKIHICPICGFANEPGATRCGKCGVAVTAGTTTVNIPDDIVDQAVVDTQHFETKHRSMTQDGVVLYIAGETQPLILRGKSTITLGRQVEGEPSDVVDTTPYYGHLLGVSRQHARLEVSPDGCTISDLNSTNGTFLNEKRLMTDTPYFVHNGDQIRLGQLIMFVYFSSASTRQQIKFKPVKAVESLLAPRQSPASYLAATISPYLDTLLTLQQMMDGLMQHSAAQPTIKTIHIDAEKSTVEVDLEGVVEALQLVQNVLHPWQEQNPAAAAKLRETGTIPTPAPSNESDEAVASIINTVELTPEATSAPNESNKAESAAEKLEEVKTDAPAASETGSTVAETPVEPVTAGTTAAPEEKATETVVEAPAEKAEEASPQATVVEDPQEQLIKALRQQLMNNGQQKPDTGRLAAYEERMSVLLQTLAASSLELMT